jgi:hypothetical protein
MKYLIPVFALLVACDVTDPEVLGAGPSAEEIAGVTVEPEALRPDEPACGNDDPDFVPVQLDPADVVLPEPGFYIPEDLDLLAVEREIDPAADVVLFDAAPRLVAVMRQLDPAVTGVDPVADPDGYAELKHAALDED